MSNAPKAGYKKGAVKRSSTSAPKRAVKATRKAASKRR